MPTSSSSTTSMGNYERDAQWKSMQRYESNNNTSADNTASYYQMMMNHDSDPTGGSVTNHEQQQQQRAEGYEADVNMPSAYYQDEDAMVSIMKRPREEVERNENLYEQQCVSGTTSRANSMDEFNGMKTMVEQGQQPQQYAMPGTMDAMAYGYNTASTPAAEFPSTWGYPARGNDSMIKSGSNKIDSTRDGSGNQASVPMTAAGPTLFGVDPMMADYESGYYSLWNGTNGANVMGYEAEAERQLPIGASTRSTTMPAMYGGTEDELKMEYGQLADLNQGELEYFYGAMDPNAPSEQPSMVDTTSEPQMERLLTMDNLKRDELVQRDGVGATVPTYSPVYGNYSDVSGYQCLARDTTIEIKRPPLMVQPTPDEAAGAALARLASMERNTAANGSTTTKTTRKSSAKRPRTRQCDFPGCTNRARSHQKCKKHGGAHQCVHEGCTKNSQSRGLCIAHGGGSRCKVEGCTRASQSKGLCKSHGGGEFCAVEGCRKKAHLRHLCRTHGGGVRCKSPKCIKWAQRKGWCMAHAKEFLGT